MSCFFCENFNHLSQNCNIYVSDRTRIEVAERRGCCGYCLTRTNTILNIPCLSCKKNEKCYICFSEMHHTAYCRERLEATRYFIPNIDDDLIPRFVKLFNLDEQVSLIFSNPNYIEMIKPEPFNVIRHYNSYNRLSNTIVNDSFDIFGYHGIPKSNISLSSTVFKGQSLNIENVIMSSEDFNQLLSPRVTSLCCKNVELTKENINFEQILQHAPNLEIISFDQINISIDNTWPEQTIKWKNGKNLRKLSISIPGFDFNIERLAALIIKKSQENVSITLKIYSDDPKYNPSIVENLARKLLPYFDRTNMFCGELTIFVKSNLNPITQDGYCCFTLKEKMSYS